MAKVLVVTSGKGGVGKTTSTAALGAALAQSGQKVVVVDFDVGLRNLDLVMGAERRVVFDLINVVQGDAKLAQALIRDKRLDTLLLLPASQTRDKDALTEEGVARVIGELREQFDWVICDSPAGIERGATLAMRHADVAVVVTNPEVSSVRDSDRIIGLLDSKTERAEKGERVDKHLLLTRYDPARAERGEMLKVDDVLEILSIAAPRHHPREPGGPARLEPRRARSRSANPRSAAGTGLSRGRAAAAGRDLARRCRPTAEPVQHAVRTEGRMNCSTSSTAAARRRSPASACRSCSRTSAPIVSGEPDLVALLREEILAVIAKHLAVEQDNVQIKMDRGAQVSTLGVDIEIPTKTGDLRLVK